MDLDGSDFGDHADHGRLPFRETVADHRFGTRLQSAFLNRAVR